LLLGSNLLDGGPMKTDFEVEQLVRHKWTKDVGRVVNVEPDYYGARQAFKVYNAQKGQALTPKSVNGIGPTKDGIRDRVLVQWYTHYVGNSAPMGWMDGKDLLLMEEQGEE